MIESGDNVDRELQNAVHTYDCRVPSSGTLAGPKPFGQKVWAVIVISFAGPPRPQGRKNSRRQLTVKSCHVAGSAQPSCRSEGREFTHGARWQVAILSSRKAGPASRPAKHVNRHGWRLGSIQGTLADMESLVRRSTLLPDTIVGRILPERGWNSSGLGFVTHVDPTFTGADIVKPQWTTATAILGLAGMALAGCRIVGNARLDPLDGTSWLLVSIDGGEPLSGIEITAVFEGGSVHGSSGCNSFGASYEIHGDNIEIREIQSTLMACIAPDGAMDQEQAFVARLSSSETYMIADGQLRLLSSGRDLLVFVPQD